MRWTKIQQQGWYKQALKDLEWHSERFFDQDDHDPLAYVLGCRYQRIRFEKPAEIKKEIDYLQRLLITHHPYYHQTRENIYRVVKGLTELLWQVCIRMESIDDSNLAVDDEGLLNLINDDL